MDSGVPHTLACPKCQQIDQVQAVSAIVSAGTQTGQFLAATSFVGRRSGWGLTTGRNTHQTLLAQRLAPPPAPRKPRWGGWALVVFTVAPLCAVYGCVPASFALVAGSSQPFQVSSSSAVVVVYGGYTVLLLAILAGALVAVWHQHRVTRWRRHLPLEHAQWQQAMAKWEHLYYCARDDGVFVPGQPSLIRVGRLRDWLFQSP